MSFRHFLIFLVHAVVLNGVYGQIPKDIVPMKSTCIDVGKILGLQTCKKSREIYDLKDEKIFITYTREVCQKAFVRFWRVPVGTVIDITRIPKKPLPFDAHASEYKSCKRDQGSSDVSGLTKYHCDSFGISLGVLDTFISEIHYTPLPDDPRAYAAPEACRLAGPAQR